VALDREAGPHELSLLLPETHLNAIAQKLGKSRHTIRKYVQAEMFPEPKKRQVAPGQLELFRAYLQARWRQGCPNPTQRWGEIQKQGFDGACWAVRRLAAEWHSKLPPEKRRTTGSKPRGRADTRAPAPRAVAWWLLGSQGKLTEAQAAFPARPKQQCPKVELAHSLALKFFAMTRRREAGSLEGSIERASASQVEKMKRFGAGLRRDWEAVVAGLTLNWSSRPVEGQVNRLKRIKPPMVGRAGLRLLRARVLPAAMAA
jgi:transposase